MEKIYFQFFKKSQTYLYTLALTKHSSYAFRGEKWNRKVDNEDGGGREGGKTKNISRTNNMNRELCVSKSLELLSHWLSL